MRLWPLASWPADEVGAIEWDFKMTGDFNLPIFPQSGKGAQEDIIAFTQVKLDLALTFDESLQVTGI